MRHTVTALLSAASICAFAWAAPAAAQAVYGTPYPAATGSCEIIAGNRVCTAAPAYGYGYGYGYGAYRPGPGGVVGAAVAAPVAAAGSLAAAPFEAAGATAGALTGAPFAPAPYPAGYAAAPVGPYPWSGPVKGNSIVPSSTSYSLPPSAETARPGVVGSCSIITGNRVCTAAPAIP
jgi:hypothetical protein